MDPQKFYLLSYGCAKNKVDTEKIAGTLFHLGLVPTEKQEEASLIIINTCAFLKDARHESWQGISRIAAKKKKRHGSLPKIIVLGCLARYYHAGKIRALLPQVDLALSPKEYGSLEDFIKRTFKKNLPEHSPAFHKAGEKRLLLSSPHSVYLKISDGCNNRCAYCLIPALRGPLRSRTMEEIEAEARVLLDLGAKEIVLVAQDTTAYGLDLYGKKMLSPLLQRLVKLNGLEWLRIMYTHPLNLDEQILNIIAAEPRICKYIDLPFQHVSDKILQDMGRGVTKKQLAALYWKIRQLIPDVVLRTTVMVGYPLEGEKEFDELLDFLQEHPFERLGTFIYSRERGTPAYKLGQPVSPEVARGRLDRVMGQQALISRDFNRRLLGKSCLVLLDDIRKVNKKTDKLIGRLFSQAPEVDGKVFVRGKGKNQDKVGDFVQVRIIGCGAHDLLAEKVR